MHITSHCNRCQQTIITKSIIFEGYNYYEFNANIEIPNNNTDLSQSEIIVETNIYEEVNELFVNVTKDSNIVLYNASKKTEVVEKEEFVKNLNKVNVIKLLNKENYTLSEFVYKIEAENTVVVIYEGGFVTINDDLYYIVDGNFDFLKDVKFYSSTGWLPWV